MNRNEALKIMIDVFEDKLYWESLEQKKESCPSFPTETAQKLYAAKGYILRNLN